MQRTGRIRDIPPTGPGVPSLRADGMPSRRVRRLRDPRRTPWGVALVVTGAGFMAAAWELREQQECVAMVAVALLCGLLGAALLGGE